MFYSIWVLTKHIIMYITTSAIKYWSDIFITPEHYLMYLLSQSFLLLPPSGLFSFSVVLAFPECHIHLVICSLLILAYSTKHNAFEIHLFLHLLIVPFYYWVVWLIQLVYYSLVKRHWVVSSFWQLWMKLLWMFFVSIHFHLSGKYKYLGVELMGHMVSIQ